jgi:hypothetical protein
VSVFSSVFGCKALKIKRVWNFTKVYRHKYRRQCVDFCTESALKLTYVHLQFENFPEAYRHKYRRQCVDFCMESGLKLTYVHLQFEKFSGGTAPGPPAAGGTPPPVPSPLTPHIETSGFATDYTILSLKVSLELSVLYSGPPGNLVLKLQIPALGAKFPFILVSNFTAEESRICIKITEKSAANAISHKSMFFSKL